MSNDRMLEVGDVLYKMRYRSTERITIDRVTAKRAFCGGLQFDRHVRTSGYVKRIGGDGYSSTSFFIESEELKAKHGHIILVGEATALADRLKAKAGDLTDAQLVEIIELLSRF